MISLYKITLYSHPSKSTHLLDINIYYLFLLTLPPQILAVFVIPTQIAHIPYVKSVTTSFLPLTSPTLTKYILNPPLCAKQSLFENVLNFDSLSSTKYSQNTSFKLEKSPPPIPHLCFQRMKVLLHLTMCCLLLIKLTHLI